MCPASGPEAARTLALPADVLVGLDDYLAHIVNVPLGGAPPVRFTSPSDIDEGTDATIEIAVSDLEGDTPTWSWDLDGAVTFGELPGTNAYVGSNGGLALTSEYLTYSNVCLPFTRAMIASVWDDLSPVGAGSNVRYQTLCVAPNRQLSCAVKPCTAAAGPTPSRSRSC